MPLDAVPTTQDLTALQNQITSLAAQIPQFSTAAPLAEAKTPAPGTMGMVPHADHVHPRLTSATTGTLNASGEQTVVFTRTFAVKPSLVLTYVETADSQPVILKVKSWTVDGSNNYTGCVIRGYRAQAIPQNLVNLLLGAVFNLFTATSAANVEFTAIAVASSA